MAKKRSNKNLYILLVILLVAVIAFAELLFSPEFRAQPAEPVQATAILPEEETTEPAIQFDKNDPNLILVNKENRVDADYEPEELVEIDVSYRATNRDPVTQKLLPETAAAFIELADAAATDGLTIKLTSGYRSYAVQKKLYDHYMVTNGEEWTNQYSAPPGASEHHTGLAADISCPDISYALDVSFADTAEGEWVEAHAHEYGFILRYQEGQEDITGYSYEPWHIRYVGKEAAAEIYKQGITLEEFLGDIE